MKKRNLTSLSLFFALQPALYGLLLPELEPTFWEVAQRGDWQALETARLGALALLRRTSTQLVDLCSAPDSDPSRLRQELETRFLAPLGL